LIERFKGGGETPRNPLSSTEAKTKGRGKDKAVGPKENDLLGALLQKGNREKRLLGKNNGTRVDRTHDCRATNSNGKKCLEIKGEKTHKGGLTGSTGNT